MGKYIAIKHKGKDHCNERYCDIFLDDAKVAFVTDCRKEDVTWAYLFDEEGELVYSYPEREHVQYLADMAKCPWCGEVGPDLEFLDGAYITCPSCKRKYFVRRYCCVQKCEI